MRRSGGLLWLTFVSASLGVSSCVAAAQQDQQHDNGASGAASQNASGQEDSGPVVLNSVVVSGQPFSAIKYQRRVKLLPDGKQRILSEANVIGLARDSTGRVRLESTEGAPGCEAMGERVLQDCQDKGVILVDPAAQAITHWPEGEIAGHKAVTIPMSQGQLADFASSTGQTPDSAADFDAQEAKIRTEKLGSRVIEGVMVTGVRTTAGYPTGWKGSSAPVTRIHEVWTSEAMRLVIRVIDGDPSGEVTISGLEHVRLKPDPSLFHPPEGYRLESNDQSGYLDHDIALLAEWGVR
jgi:hypothetical protein